MSHIKDRLSSYHDWMQDIVNRYKLVMTKTLLGMILLSINLTKIQ